MTDTKGKVYKFSFKHRKDHKVVYEYLVGHTKKAE